ncbi:ribonuclease [Putridiphycobacter roseus]|uniref:Ribonuclease n=1 Tax=Putridiphycobacter roseus TaxID=2219161 RepID=A0A2W1NS85_9FLAO|nr:PhoH family protein [Putridiphycobacter roseus]PZE18512.1 ribonuclease [Putridiphycobacter roseus]
MATSKKTKIFVIDTSVILHDHHAIHNFDEHDIAIPITVLEELDNFKKGNDTKNYEAREFIRFLDKLSNESTLDDWIPLDGKGKGKIKIVLNAEVKDKDATLIFGDNKADHQILNVALGLKESTNGRQVILVTKDINLRLKAKALSVIAQDYQSGKVNDVHTVLKGANIIKEVESELIQEIYKNGYTTDISVLGEHPVKNEYLILQNGKSTSLAFYNGLENRLDKVDKSYVYGIKPKNAEQSFAVNALLNDNIKLITLQGVAGTGKTLLALASAIEQRNQYNQIILARPIVPLSNRDIGFLPGDANEKINPYMQPLFDNLTFIKNQYRPGEKKYKQIEDLQTDNRMVIMPLAFIRGRSLSNVFFIVDEAQNLTPHEVKTIITRAGEGTKIVFTGDIHQIDTPYLDENSNGLSYLIDRLKGNALYAHIKLEKGERSQLANLANELL